MARDFTEFQQQAIETNGTDICVAAGAGSGKTGVLVERFVRLITQSREEMLPPEQRASVGEVLVITFTEKATKEMKTRIVAELNRLGLVNERRQIETAYISTIHGFCSRLLQENPFEAGVDPQFTVLDESQARRLLHRTFEAVIAGAYAHNDTETIELVAAAQTARQYGEDVGEPLSEIENAAKRILDRLRGAGWALSELERHWRQGCEATAGRALEPVWGLLTPLLIEISACLEGIQALRAGLMGTMEITARTLLEQTPKLCLRAGPLPETLSALEIAFNAIKNARPRPGCAHNELEVFQLFQRIRTACEEAKTLFGLAIEREQEATLLCHRLLGLVIALWKAYDDAKRTRGVLDNDDLQAEGVHLLEQSPGVRARYRRRFRHLMVDEFQDTNPLQMRLIELLHNSENAVDTTEPRNYLFVVGDVQQSIYGFRNAEPRLFRALERRFREENVGQHVPLAVNFRSRPEILRLVERVFKQLWREERTPFVPLTQGAPFEDKPTPSLEILLSEGLYRRDYVNLEADALAARIHQMVEGGEMRLTAQFDPRCGEPVAYRDVALLLRSLTDIQKYEEAFARRGVPYFVVGGGRGYYARHEIRDLLNVLTVLDTPHDDLALAATLRSPMVGADVDTLYRLAKQAGHTDSAKTNGNGHRRNPTSLYAALPALLDSSALPEDEAVKLRPFFAMIETLRGQEDRLPVGHLLERLIAWTNYDARLLCRPGGRRRLANVRKLLQMANADSIPGVREFTRRLRDLEKLSDREGDAPTEEEAADVVRFLTIHGAKGLEFPVVILADMGRRLIHPARDLFICEPEHLALGTRLGGDPNVTYKAIDLRQQATDRKESERLLYVAMTRAREHLILCGNVGRKRESNWASDLFEMLGVLNAPPEPEVHTLIGNLVAQIAPLSHYVHAPRPAQTAASVTAEAHADKMVEALLNP